MGRSVALEKPIALGRSVAMGWSVVLRANGARVLGEVR